MTDSDTPRRLTFPPEQRLRRPQDFERVYARRMRASDERLLVFAATNDQSCARMGCSVSRRQGNSVMRHRLKRLLREAFRLSQHELPTGLDLILIPKQLQDASVADVQKSLSRLIPRLARKLKSVAEGDPPTPH